MPSGTNEERMLTAPGRHRVHSSEVEDGMFWVRLLFFYGSSKRRHGRPRLPGCSFTVPSGSTFCARPSSAAREFLPGLAGPSLHPPDMLCGRNYCNTGITLWDKTGDRIEILFSNSYINLALTVQRFTDREHNWGHNRGHDH